MCDNDADNDGVDNAIDNCPIVANPGQEDSNGDGVGDACTDDCDGDTVIDELDVCPCNGDIVSTDFRAMQLIDMGENSYSQPHPVWELKNEGKEIHQLINSAPGIGIGNAKLTSVEFEGTIYIDCCSDDDWLGSIFSYQVF